ncbi:PAS domain-containing protein [Tomitella gaofuii]|uniref:PAS domain-containing protein n=1 Tax=Tomitella gaofuii TaxID=2760083 RepID=UPI0015FAC6C0|nr:PAS domain-containing protein [Tomitella gaofuii]
MTASERRRPQPTSPLGFLESLPSLTLLDRLHIPILSVHDDGDIIYANPAAEDMLGYGRNWLTSCKSGSIFRDVAAALTPPPMTSYLRRHADTIIDLVHWDGSTVRAIVSGPTLLRSSDPVALVSLQNVTERLWNGDPTV